MNRKKLTNRVRSFYFHQTDIKRNFPLTVLSFNKSPSFNNIHNIKNIYLFTVQAQQPSQTSEQTWCFDLIGDQQSRKHRSPNSLTLWNHVQVTLATTNPQCITDCCSSYWISFHHTRLVDIQYFKIYSNKLPKTPKRGNHTYLNARYTTWNDIRRTKAKVYYGTPKY